MQFTEIMIIKLLVNFQNIFENFGSSDENLDFMIEKIFIYLIAGKINFLKIEVNVTCQRTVKF